MATDIRYRKKPYHGGTTVSNFTTQKGGGRFEKDMLNPYTENLS